MKFKILFFIFALVFSSLPLYAMDQEFRKSDRFLRETYYGNIKYVKENLLDGTDPDTEIIMPDQPWYDHPWYNKTPLIIAAQKGHFEIAQLLLKCHANVNARDNDGWTSLMYAAACGYIAIVKILLDYHAKVNARNKWDETALMRAACNGHTNIVKLLLKYHAKVNVADNDGSTPLMRAAVHGYTKIVKFLLDHHADVNAQDKQLLTALHHAAIWSRSTIVNILLKHGADINITDVSYPQRAFKFSDPKPIEPFLKHIFDQARNNPEKWHLWDRYILSVLNESEYEWRWSRSYPIETINAFRMLLHHADKLPLSRKKFESLTAKALRKTITGEKAFKKTIEHIRKNAF